MVMVVAGQERVETFTVKVGKSTPSFLRTSVGTRIYISLLGKLRRNL